MQKLAEIEQSAMKKSTMDELLSEREERTEFESLVGNGEGGE